MTAPRAARAALVEILHDCGYSRREIADLLGISESGVRSLVNDPTGEKQRARRERYRGTCSECGAATDGSNGREAAPTICARCAAIRQHDERHWTRETVLASIATLNVVDVAVDLPIQHRRLLATLGVAVRFVDVPTAPRRRAAAPPAAAVRDAVQAAVADDDRRDALADQARAWLANA